MSSVNLDSLISEFPEQKSTVKRLADFFEQSRDASSVKEFTIQRIFDVAQPVPQSVLVEILHRFAEQGVVRECVRVESESLGGIGDFDSIEDIPLVIDDWRLGREVEVSLDRLRWIYKLLPKSTSKS